MKVKPILKSKFYFLAVVLCLILFSPALIKAQTAINGVTSLTHIGGYHIKCNGQSTGTLTANPSFGVSPYNYLWNTGETTRTINTKPAGIYFVTITDSLNNTDVATFELKQPYILDYQASLSDYFGYNIEAHGGENGIIQLAPNGGTPPYRYLWNNGDSESNRKGLAVGTYSFTITDANQCSTNGSITLTEPNPINISFSGVENPKCFNSEDGKATINITGGLGDFSVVWDNGSFSLSPEDLISGLNTVRVYEHGKAVLDTGITLTTIDAIDVQFTYSDYNGFNVSCVDCFNGSITTSTTGGTTPYTYMWDDVNNSTTANLNNLNGGNYTLSITDAHGCISNNTAQLTMPTPKDWSRYGNANIDTSEFIGSTDTSAVVFKTNNQEALRLAGNGNVGIKNSNPTEALDILGNLKTSGMMIFGGQTYVKERSGNGGSPEGFSFSFTPIDASTVIARPVCLTDAVKYNTFPGLLASRDPNISSIPVILMGMYQGKGIIETSYEIGGQDPNPLNLNTICGLDVIVGKPNSYGNLIANNKLGIGISQPNERLEVAGNAIVDGKLSVGGPGNNGYFTVNTDYQLCVNGKIVATEVLVKLRQDWPDYVFKKDYKMKSIKEVKSFIKSHGHLPGIPSAKEINDNGINTGEMLNLQMQKIEELTLYIIDLQKQIDALKQAKN